MTAGDQSCNICCRHTKEYIAVWEGLGAVLLSRLRDPEPSMSLNADIAVAWLHRHDSRSKLNIFKQAASLRESGIVLMRSRDLAASLGLR